MRLLIQKLLVQKLLAPKLLPQTLLAFLLALNIAGVYAAEVPENPYAKSFVSRGRPSIALQPDPAGPKLYRGDNQVDDYKRMLENGFDMLGYSSFQGLDVSPEKATEQARDIKADMVLVYAERKGGTPATVQIDQARQKAKEKNSAAEVDVPQAKDQKLYEYFASYWVKLAPPLIGVHVEANTQDENSLGLRVIAVVKDSPAAKAGITDEDVLTRIGEFTLDKPEALTKAAQHYAGKTVDVSYKRGDNEASTSMTLNSRK
jgi:PDZ domain-containing protein